MFEKENPSPSSPQPPSGVGEVLDHAKLLGIVQGQFDGFGRKKILESYTDLLGQFVSITSYHRYRAEVVGKQSKIKRIWSVIRGRDA